MRLFILFDRPAAPDQSPFLKFCPRTVRDPDNADWAEPEGITLATVLHILVPKLVLDGAGQPVGEVVRAASRPLRSEASNTEDHPRSEQGDTTSSESRLTRWAASTAAIT